MTKLFKVLVTENVTLGKEIFVEAESRAMVETYQDEIIEHANEEGGFDEESCGVTVDSIEEFWEDVATAPDLILPLTDEPMVLLMCIKTDYGTIKITKAEQGAVIDLPDALGDPSEDNALDTVVSMILGHVSAGVDVTTDAYAQGINMALQAIGNQD